VLAHEDGRFGIVDDVRQLTRTEHRHRGHANRADFLDGEPRRREGDAVEEPHRYAVARLDAETAERMTDAIGQPLKLTVGRASVAGEDRRSIGVPVFDVIVEQHRRQIQRRRILELRPVANDGRPQIFGRQVMAKWTVNHQSLG